MMRRTVYYATRSPYKKEELLIIANESFTVAGALHTVGDVIEFQVSSTPTEEPLEIDLEAMVRHKVRSAYRKILAPCIVEHAGLILEKNAAAMFPGGLTQPMWDYLGPQGFIDRIGCGGERATARAVVGYCNGKEIRTFVGETKGSLARKPTGGRGFYWDVIFVPDEVGTGQTYAEIAEQPNGLAQKLHISQSTKAIKQLAAFLLNDTSDGTFAID